MPDRKKTATRVSYAFLCILLLNLPATARTFKSYAFVNDDGTLKVQRRTIHLYGVYLPPTARSCQTQIRPVRCGPRAVLALEFKIGSSFVNCEQKERHQDGSIVALCRVNGEDLGAYLLQRGWAVATPDAPFEYQALEKIARHRGVGVWGISIDRIR